MTSQKTHLATFLCVIIFLSLNVNAQKTFLPKAVELPNGWSLSPAGAAINLSSDLPLNMAISPDEKYVAITDNGNGKQGIDLLNVDKKQLLSFTQMPAAWVGLQFSHDGKYLYASTGEKNKIIRFKVEVG